MLKALTVQDFALVQSLDINFEPGLTVITGESGAGKSILLGALGLVVGQRADSDAVRPGAARAEVNAEFDLVDQPDAQEFLATHELQDVDQPTRCLVRRVVSSEGRSRAFINATPVTLQVLRQLTERLVEIHGQHESQRLTDTGAQLRLLDDYGVDAGLLQRCLERHRAWQKASRDIEAMQNALTGQEDRASLLAYQVEELAELALTDGEFESLSAEHKRASQAHSLRETVGRALEEIDAREALGRIQRDLEGIEDAHPGLVGARDALGGATALLDDAARDLRAYLTTLEVDPAALQDLEARLSLVMDLARKHKIDPSALSAHQAALSAELEGISTDRSALAALRESAADFEAQYRKAAQLVSKQRREAADQFATAVSACMQALGITEGSLALEFKDQQSERGLEAVEFLVVTNPKYPAAPLAKIASGGERTRIALAIAVVAAERSALPSLLLDEADVGVGGTTADVVGRLLRDLAGHAQVICVTHAPQVAALGQNHLLVQKSPRAETHIEPLQRNERVDELARMLAGAGITAESRAYAQTLLEEAGNGPVH